MRLAICSVDLQGLRRFFGIVVVSDHYVRTAYAYLPLLSIRQGLLRSDLDDLEQDIREWDPDTTGTVVIRRGETCGRDRFRKTVSFPEDGLAVV